MQIRVEDTSRLQGIPMLIVSADTDPNHPGNTDAETAAFVGADHIALADRGLENHGHLMMLEHRNLEIADVILEWLEAHARTYGSLA